jgi:hypothetical protein
MHMCTWPGIRYPSMIWQSFCLASEWKIGPSYRRVWPNRAFRRRLARTQRGTCSPILSGVGSDKALTLHALLADFTKPLGEVYSSTVNLFESHWSIQWLAD